MFVRLTVLLLLFTCTARADWLTSPERGKRGWYGYEVRKEEKKKKVKEKKKEEKKKAFQWPSPDELYHMKVAEIRKWIGKAADEAISRPTEENIKRWILYMKVADRKATEFAGMWAWVMQKNPDLYREAALYPAVRPGSRAFWKKVWRDVKEKLRKEAHDYALLFFFHPDDPFSEAQSEILKLFREENPDWTVKNIKVTPELAERFGINYTPQIWLLPRKTGKPVPLAAGVISVNRLEKKIYHTILVLEGKLPPQLAPYQPFKVER